MRYVRTRDFTVLVFSISPIQSQESLLQSKEYNSRLGNCFPALLSLFPNQGVEIGLLRLTSKTENTKNSDDFDIFIQAMQI